MFAQVRINPDQVGLWYRRGRFLRALGPGDYPVAVFADGSGTDHIEVIPRDDPRREQAEREAPPHRDQAELYA